MLNHLAEHARQHGISLLRLETGIYQGRRYWIIRTLRVSATDTIREYREDPISVYFEKKID